MGSARAQESKRSVAATRRELGGRGVRGDDETGKDMESVGQRGTARDRYGQTGDIKGGMRGG